MNFLGLIFILTCLPSALIDFAAPLWKNEPAMQMEEAYKWTYQATRGGEHAAPDREMAKRWMDEEWKGLSGPIRDEPVWEPLCGNGSIGRLNLRPFKQKGGIANDLVDAFVSGAKEFKGTEADFLAAWNELGKRLEKNEFGELTYKNWKNLDTAMKAKNYPAVHHSEAYKKAMAPAYRILPAAEMKNLTGKLWIINRDRQ
jgi:hypothetical protein